ncbi:unnamed protein product [Paramecium sonneborni]|uniref:TmcB/TmcC TPR repeats domain-containing protein n=1 Tax=Paramecium sonneborni TaxID=65129 RepID=A0A8S1Q6D7_9CILI|nr:unnamed protein product [Paramecium sonneborni]
MEAESEVLKKLINNTKYKLFNVVYLILKRQQYPLNVAIISTIIQMGQLLYFSFQQQLRYIWRSENLTKWVNYILAFFTLMKYVENKELTIYLIVFYICVGLVQITVILIIILGVLKQNQSSSSIVFSILRLSLTILMTIGFEPISRILLGYLACESQDQGNLMMRYVKNQQCWVSEYELHAVIAILTFAEYMIMVIIFAQICIESKEVEYNVVAQKQGQTMLYYYLFIFISLLSYSLLEQPKYTLIVILFQLVSSFTFFYGVNQQTPFYNTKIQKIWSIIAGVNFWTQLMLFYAYHLEGRFLQKTLVIWIVGIPFIIAILAMKELSYVDLVTACMKSNQNGIQTVQICTYILTLNNQSATNQKSQILLAGFIEFHKQSCSKPDCVLLSNQKKKNKSVNVFKDRKQQIDQLVNQNYLDGLEQFPECVNLKISYSYFLLDKMQLKQQALNQLNLAESCDPSFDQQFFIYRYKRIIEEQIQKQQQSNNHNKKKLDIITEKTLKSEIKNLHYLIEDSCMEYLYFWSQLQEEVPNLKILYEHGQKIIKSILKVEQQWYKILEIDPYEIGTHRIISKYYEMIVHDEQLALDQLIQMIKKQKYNTKGNEFYEDLSSSGDPLIVMQISVGHPTLILNVNKAAYSLLGFSKTDLINRNIDVILPTIYVEYHTQLIDFFFDKQTGDANQINQFQERFLMIKNKQNYIVPCYSQSQILNTINGFIMTSRLRQEVHYKPKCYILIDIHGKILHVSSSCMQILKLDQQFLHLKDVNITKFFPELLLNREEYLSKPTLIHFELQCTSSKGSLSKDDVANSFDEVEDKIFNCSLFLIETPYANQNDDIYQIYGYIVKLEQYSTDITNFPLLIKNKKTTKVFKFYVASKTYQLENADPENTNNESLIEKSIIWEEPQKLYLFAQHSNTSSKKQYSQSKHSLLKSKVYGADIKTMRYFDNKIIEIEEESIDESEYSEKKQNKGKNLNAEDENDLDKQVQIEQRSLKIATRLGLIKVINNSKLPFIMLKLSICISLLFLSVLIVSIIMFIMLNQTQGKIVQALNLLIANNLRLCSFIKMQSNLQDLKFTNFKILPYTQQTVSGHFEFINRLELAAELNLTLEYQLTLQNQEIILNGEYAKYDNAFKTQKILMQQVTGESSSFLFEEVIQQLLSKAISLNSSSLTSFDDLNQDYYYFNENLFNSVLLNQHLAQDFYYYNIIYQTDQLDQLQIYFSLTQLFLIILTYIIIQIFLNKHQSYLREILSLFMELDEKTIKFYVKKAQDFLSALRLADDKQLDEIDEEQDEEEDHFDLSSFNRKKRRNKSFSTKEIKKNIIYVSMVLICYAFFFSYIFITSKIIISQTEQLTPLLNITSIAASQYSLIDNIMREAFWNQSKIILDLNAFTALAYMQNVLYEMDAESHQLNQENSAVLDVEYKMAFNQIYILNPCFIIDEGDDKQSACSQFYDGILLQGLSLGVTKFLETIKFYLFLYQGYNSSYHYSYLSYNLSTDPLLNYSYNLLNQYDMNSNRILTKVYMKSLQIYLTDILQSSLNTHFEDLQLQFVSTFLSFSLLSIILYFMMWIPRLQKNRQEIYQNRMMLSFIPLKKLDQIEPIKSYIRKYQQQE